MLFISHSTIDKTHALELKRYLLKQGYRDQQLFLDSEREGGIPLGGKWENEIYRNIHLCRAVIVLCSSHWNTSKWCFAELATAKMCGKAIFPIVIEQCDLSVLNEYQALLALQFADNKTIFEWLSGELKKQGYGPSDSGLWPHPDLRDLHGKIDNCPFPGLSAFDERYQAVYFGRERERDELLEQLQRMRNRGEPRFLMIVGGSGSGKSSLLKAGILPRLSHPNSASDWFVFRTMRFGARMTPGALFELLASEIIKSYPSDAEEKGFPQVNYSELCERFAAVDGAKEFISATRALVTARGMAEPTILLPIDQFEEFLASSTAQRKSHVENKILMNDAESGQSASIREPCVESAADGFLRFLHDLCVSADNRVLVIGTMRSDYLDVYERHSNALRSPQFRAWRLEPFARELIEHIIVEPANRVGLEISEDLVDRLKLDSQNSDERKTDALPLLAFTLEKLFRQFSYKGRLELEDYKNIDGLEGAIRQTVEKIMPSNSTYALPSGVIAAIRLCFTKHLAQINDKGEFVRRSALWEEVIADIHNDVTLAASEVLEKLVEARLLTKTIAENEGNEQQLDAEPVTLEVTHEAIFRCWPPLGDWLNGSARILRWRRDVRRDQESAALNKQKWSGLKAEQLAVSREWPTTRRAELSKEETLWIKKAIRRTNFIKLSIIFTMLMLAVLGGLASLNSQKVEYQSRVARSKGLAAESYKYQESNPQLAAILAVEADDIEPTVESLGAILQIVYGSPKPQLIATPEISSFAVSPTQELAATGHPDGNVMLWPFNRKSPKVLKGSDWKASQLTFDVTGQLLAVSHKAPFSADDKLGDRIETWNVNDNVQIGKPIHALGNITWMDVSQDGKTLFTTANTLGVGLLRVWNIETGNLIAGPVSNVSIGSISPNGKVLAAIISGRIKYLNLSDLTLLEVGQKFYSDVTKAIFDKTGNWLITGHDDGKIRFSRVPEKFTNAGSSPQDHDTKNETVLSGHTGSVTSLSIHPNGKVLASGSVDGTIRLWHIERREPLVPANKPHYVVGTGFDNFTNALVDDTEITSPEPHGEPLLVGFKPEEKKSRWSFYPSSSMLLGFSADGNTIVGAPSGSEAIQLWETPFGKPVISYSRSPGKIEIATKSGVFVKATGFSADVFSINGEKLPKIDFGEYIYKVMLDGDGNLVAVAGQQSLQVFNASTGKPYSPILSSGRKQALSPDGKLISIARPDNQIVFLDTETGANAGKPISEISSQVTSMAFSSDSHQIGIGTNDGSVHIFDIATNREISHISEKVGSVSLLSFDTSARLMAVADDKSTVRIFDTRTSERLGPVLAAGTEKILTLRFSHDGSVLACGTEEIGLRLWDVVSGQQIGPDIDTKQAAEAVRFGNDKELYVITRDLAPKKILLSSQLLRSTVASLTGRNATYEEWDRFFGFQPYKLTFKEYGLHQSFLTEARRRALDGRIGDAIDMFQRAVKLQPSLNLDPSKTAKQIKLLADAENSARNGNIVTALSQFSEAKGLGWQESVNVNQRTIDLAIEGLMKKGNRLAEQNEMAEAIKAFESVLKIIGDNQLQVEDDFDNRSPLELYFYGPEKYAKNIALNSLLLEAEDFAQVGRIEDAADKFKAAGQYSEEYANNPLERARSLAVESLRKEAEVSIARNGLERSRSLYMRVKQVDPSFDAEKEFNRVLAGVKRGQVENLVAGQLERALTLLDEAQKLDPLPPEQEERLRKEVLAKDHIDKGDKLAAKGDIQAAIQEYKAGLVEKPSAEIVPGDRAKLKRLNTIRNQAQELLGKGDRLGTINALKALLTIDSKLSLDNELIVLTIPSKDSRTDLRRYLEEKQEKVFLLTPLGSWQYAYGYNSINEALAEAFKGARERFGGDEAYVYMKGNRVVAKNEELEVLRKILRDQ